MIVLLLALVMPAEAGKKNKTQDAEPVPAAAAVDSGPQTVPDPFADFDRAGVIAKMQGTWHIVSSEYGSIGALFDVKGTSVHLVRPIEDLTFEIALTSPCDYWLKNPEAGNRKGSYAFDGGTFLTGAVGQRIGEKVYACVYDGVHVIEAGACTKYAEHFGEWTKAPGACRTGADGAIEIDDGGSTYRLVPRGEAYVEESGWQGKVERLPDLASGLERVKAP